MKKNLFLPALLLSFLTAGYAQAESIVMKSTASGLEALSDADIEKHGEAVSEILQKYCWPMCQNSDLTAEEQHELLSPEGNEERFLNKKLNETISASERDFEFAVVFVPTTLYELFLIAEVETEESPLAGRFSKFKITWDGCSPFSIKEFKSDINQFYVQCSKPDEKFFTVLKSHSLFMEQLMLALRKINFSNKTEISSQIRKNIMPLCKLFTCNVLYKRLKANPSLLLKKNIQEIILVIAQKHFPNIEKITEITEGNLLYIEKSIFELFLNDNMSLILEYIEQEYNMHKQNLAFISRGSNPVMREKGPLIASTQKNSSAYSASFANTLFSGCIFDPLACVYNYLSKPVVAKTNNLYDDENNIVGFIVKINKLDHYLKKNHFFVIPPLPTGIGLLSVGQFFHPRSTTAQNDSKEVVVKGIIGSNLIPIKDPLETFVLRKETLLHELQYLQYINENFYIFYNRSSISEANLKTSHKKYIAQIRLKLKEKIPFLIKQLKEIIGEILKTHSDQPVLRARL
jgi:hypothetical protein